jgi:hypothetical protein
MWFGSFPLRDLAILGAAVALLLTVATAEASLPYADERIGRRQSAIPRRLSRYRLLARFVVIVGVVAVLAKGSTLLH